MAAPDEPTGLYAATTAGVFRSFDGGESWEAASRGLADARGFLPPGGVLSLAIDPGDSPMAAATFVGFVFDPSDDNRIVGAASRAEFQGKDAGASWERFTRGLSPGDQGVPSVTSIAVDLARPEQLYAGTPSGLFTLTLGALRHWERAGLADRDIVYMLSLPGGSFATWENRSGSTSAYAKAWARKAFLQREQWQDRASRRGPVNSYRMAPQKHSPVIVMAAR